MKVILKLFIFLALFLNFGVVNNTINITNAADNLNVSTIEKGENNRNNLLKDLKDDNFFGTRYGGTKGAYGLMFRIAKDLKNLFFVLATLYLFIIVIRLLYSGESDEGFTKFKNGVIWTSVGIFVIQAAYAYVKTLYDKDIGQNLAFNLIENLVNPLIGMLEMFASIVFLIMAIIAFYQLITANGNDETAKKGKMTIVYAIIGFILIKLAKVVVEGVYGKLNCNNSLGGIISSGTVNCVDTAKIDGFAGTILQIINWMNSFIGLVVVLMIIYAGMQILTSGGDEEKTKKAKKSLIYIMIGLFLLFTNYIILTFFIKPESLI